jgi:hypothetical protein
LQLQIDEYYLAVVDAGMEFFARLAQSVCSTADVQQFDSGGGTARGEMVRADTGIVSAADLVCGGI